MVYKRVILDTGRGTRIQVITLMHTHHLGASRTLYGSRYAWWSGNARLIELNGKLLGAHISHASLLVLWAGSMSLFELCHYIKEKPLYEQGFILLPHLSTLSFGVGPGGEIVDVYVFFVIGVLHLLSSGVLALGGLYHSILGPERLEETRFGSVFAFQWQDRFKVTSILGAHLISLGIARFLLWTLALQILQQRPLHYVTL